MIPHTENKYKEKHGKTRCMLRECAEDGGSYGQRKCIFETGDAKEYFEICSSDDCDDCLYVFLYNGGRSFCVEPDRNRRIVGN